MRSVLVVLLFGAFAWGQAKPAQQPSMPSKEEVSELVTKADEKVSGFEEAVKNAKPHLDRINPKLTTNYMDAASTAASSASPQSDQTLVGNSSGNFSPVAGLSA